MPHLINLTLSYSGKDAETHQLDFYDAAQALIGFERSLALTTHLILNGKIITQAPALKGAKIYVAPPEAGSWEIIAAIATASAGTTAYKLTTAPRDTPLGHLVSSVYDYVIQRTLGFTVDFDKTLGRQYREMKEQQLIGEITPQKLDSLVEKTETAIKMIHRPIVESESAVRARISSKVGSDEHELGRPLTRETYDRMKLIERSRELRLDGRVSSYNINTFRGRVYIEDEQRPIPFELAETARDDETIATVAQSLARNAVDRDRESDISFRAFKITTNTGRLKGLLIVEVD